MIEECATCHAPYGDWRFLYDGLKIDLKRAEEKLAIAIEALDSIIERDTDATYLYTADRALARIRGSDV